MIATATPPALKPQTLQVLNDLRAADKRGVHSFEFHARFIADPAKRVCELIALGYVIDRKPERLAHDGARGTRYTLLSEPGQDGPPPVAHITSAPGSPADASRDAEGRSEEGRSEAPYGRDPSVVVRCADSTFYAPVRSGKWRNLKPGSLVFTCSWSDWFHENADPWRDEAWEVLRQRPDLNWQILTKRPENILDRLPADWGDGWPNVWLGVSIENRRFVGRADVLRQVPAAVRFISAEPLLGPLLWNRGPCSACGEQPDEPCQSGPYPGRMWGCDLATWQDDALHSPELDLTGIDWLIAGGESGKGHRLMRPEWVRDLREACLRSGTAFFLKQWGA